jgi:hypothetical protein
MRVMVDSNIIISAMVFRSSKMCDVLRIQTSATCPNGSCDIALQSAG